MRTRTEVEQDRALDQLFGHLGIQENGIDPPPPSDLVQPTHEGIIIMGSGKDKFIYSRPEFHNGTWFAYANHPNSTIGNPLAYQLESVNGLSNWEEKLSNAPYGSLIYDNGQWKGLAHQWYNNYCYTYSYGSENSLLWGTQAVDRNNKTGEDRTWLNDNGLYRCYIRPFPPKIARRSIGYMESRDHRVGWSNVIEVLVPDSQDKPTEHFYMMSVIKTNFGYFGLLTIYDTVQPGTTYLQLVYSQNGVTNWHRCNDRKPFINLKPGYLQMYGNWNVIGDTAYIHTIEGKTGHDVYMPNEYLHSSRYKIKLTDLYAYKPEADSLLIERLKANL